MIKCWIAGLFWKTLSKLRDLNKDEYLEFLTSLKLDVETDGSGLSKTPTYGSSLAHAFDVYSPESVTIPPGDSTVIDTGRKFKLPKGMAAVLWSRSGLAANFSVEKGAGLLDSDFADTWKVVLRNHGNKEFTINKDDRIVQCFLLPRFSLNFLESDDIKFENDRGGGLGSTGR